MPEPITLDKIPAILFEMLILSSIVMAWIGVFLRLAFRQPVLPPRTPRIVPWGLGSFILGIVAWLGLQMFVPFFYYLATHPRPANAAPAPMDLSPGEQMGLSAVVNALILLLIPLALRLTCGASVRDFGMSWKAWPRQALQGVVAYLLLAPFIMGAMLGALLIWKKTNHPLEDAIKLDHAPGMLTVLVLAGVVFAPLAEELIFRGLLLGWLTRMILGKPKPAEAIEFVIDSEPSDIHKPVSETETGFADLLDRDPENPYAPPKASLEVQPEVGEAKIIPISTSTTLMLVLANVVTSLIFAVLHAPVWPTPIPIFFLSLGLGFLYQRTGSLMPSMALHMTFNGVSTILMILTLGTVEPKPKDDAKPLVSPPAKVQAQWVRPEAVWGLAGWLEVPPFRVG